MKQNHSERTDGKGFQLDSPHKNPKKGLSDSKNNYIGLTLKEYLGLENGNNCIEEMDEESTESLLTSSPTFKTPPPNGENTQNWHITDKKQLKASQKEELLSIVNSILHHPQSKIPKINLEDFGNFQKHSQKLPAIHQRNMARSRNAVSKDQNKEIKKQRCLTLKTEEIADMVNDPILSVGKNNLKIKLNEFNKHSIEMKKATRPRVVSTTFYNMQLKERGRMKTEDYVADKDKHFQKIFMITRYKDSGFSKRRKYEQAHGAMKKY